LIRRDEIELLIIFYRAQRIIHRDRDDTRTFRFWIIFRQEAPKHERFLESTE